jgi:hypothetical protein
MTFFIINWIIVIVEPGDVRLGEGTLLEIITCEGTADYTVRKLRT